MNAKRTVFLVDMNAFFISCETTRDPSLAGGPSAVAGDPKNRTGIILAANYEARAFGVKTAMTVGEALGRCPQLRRVAPDHDFYVQKSDEVMTLLSSFTPVLEQSSVDEAWLDMTGCENLFGPPVDAARRIMSDIQEKLGLFCSIGIAENKFLSKMAAEMKKPQGITELWQQDVPVKLWPLPVHAMVGIGESTATRLHRMGIQTIGDLANCDESLIVQTLGKSGRSIRLRAQGVDDEPVTPNIEGDSKSIGRSTTLPRDITDMAQAMPVLLALADDVGLSTRQQGKKGNTVTVTVKYSDFTTQSRQTTIPATGSTQMLYRTGCELLRQCWKGSRPIRLIGIRLSGFEDSGKREQLSFFEETGQSSVDERSQRIDEAMDRIRQKHGRHIIRPGTLIEKDNEDHKDKNSR